jgi:hypothetical protein
MVICEYRWMEEPKELGRGYLPGLSSVQSMETKARKLWKSRMG